MTDRPRLRVIEGGASSRSVTTSPSTVLVVAAIMVTMTLVVLVRGVQGAPPASDWNSLAALPPAATSPVAGVASDAPIDDGRRPTTFTVGHDDTWASIAAEVAPGADPVDVARQLAGINGGYALHPGQVLTVSLAP